MNRMLIAVDQEYLDRIVKALSEAEATIQKVTDGLIKEHKTRRGLELLNPEEAANYLKVSPSILDYYEKNGLPYYRTCHKGKWYRRGEIDEWLESGAVNRHKKGRAKV